MKKRYWLFVPLLIFAVLAVLLWQGLGRDPSSRESALLEKLFPAFSLTTLEDSDKAVDASLLKGQVTLVNVWGEWCPTCKREMPQLLALAERGVHLVGVDYKDTRDNGQRFLDEFGNPFALNIFDPEGSLGFDLGVYGAPESFIVDANGNIRYHHTGYIKPEDIDDVIMPEIQRWQ
ncbi:cytochrome c biogenesis protein CcmG, thiol:disulfide interchange protein DsbE [Kushneria avicenniae]|uniref:Cytochrome c biogenesis protein CcmG, thiol:disulfide interchange protein DsbE n=1 Tax=Kushneria avicenniae TaxID=402385 RepID=A0A1I1LPM3_9GAMM|nr:DsbE family thiol:disulfide interchange protein [Kushneria avicenniae]SFC72898.1 cytochrome c biogenesis protein CcmG, thiol:disulfide interchange protein DsbE [Kushneria avicenniae]